MGTNRPFPVRVPTLAKVFVWALAIFLVLYFSRAFRVAGFGFLAIAAISSALQPLVKYVPAKRWLAGAIVGFLPGLILVGGFVLAGWLLAEPIRREARNWPQVQQSLNNSLAGFSERAGIDPPLTVQGIVTRFSPQGNGGVSPVARIAGALTDFLVAAVLISFGTIFFLATPTGTLLHPTLQLLPPKRRAPFRAALDELYTQLRWWVIGTVTGITTVGVLSYVGFRLAGLQFGGPLAVLCGVAELVPNVGPAAAFLLALGFGAAQGGQTVLYVAIVWAVIQVIESYVLWPLVMKRAVDIPPIVTLLTIVFWGHVFGVAGLLLAIPLDLLAWTFAKHFILYKEDDRDIPMDAAAA